MSEDSIFYDFALRKYFVDPVLSFLSVAKYFNAVVRKYPTPPMRVGNS